MPTLAIHRPELFDQGQAAEILTVAAGDDKKFHRHTIGDVAPRLGLSWKTDPKRPNARLLDRSDVTRLAGVLNITIDWDELQSA
jgi:hypothetical protein